MGSPAAEAVPSAILAGIAAVELGRARRLRLRRDRGRSAAARRAAGDAERHQRRDHRRPADHHGRRHAGPRPVLQDLRRPGRPRRRRVADVHQRQRDRAVVRRARCWRCRSTTTGWTSTRSSAWSTKPAGPRRRSTRSRPSRTRPASTMSLERRQRLLELARSWGSMVIDDDPYGLLRFAGEPLPTLRELGAGDPLVFAVRTFSQDRRARAARRLGRHRPRAAAAADQRQAGDGHLHEPAGAAAAHRLPHRRPSGRSPGHPARRVQAAQGSDARGAGTSTSATSPAGPTPRAVSSCWVTLENGVDADSAVRGRTGRGRRLHPRHGVLPVRPIRATPCGCASRPPRRTGSTRASPGCGAPSIWSRRADRRGRVRRRAGRVWTGSTRTLLVDVDPRLRAGHGQNPPGEEAATVAVLPRLPRPSLGSTSLSPSVEPGPATTSASPLPGGDGPGLLLLGHTDVVPSATGWTKDPFGGATARRPHLRPRRLRHEGRSRGLPSSAMAALRGTGLSGPGRAGGARRRGGDRQRHPRVRRLVAMRRSWLGCITAEPTDLQTIVGARGDSYLGSKCTERPVTQAIPADGANAIYGAAAVVAEIERCTPSWRLSHTRCSVRRRGVSGRSRRYRRLDRARRMRGGRRPPIASGRVAAERARRSPGAGRWRCGWRIAA